MSWKKYDEVLYTRIQNKFATRCLDTKREVDVGGGVLAAGVTVGTKSFVWEVLSAEAVRVRAERGETPVTTHDLNARGLSLAQKGVGSPKQRDIKGGKKGATLWLSVSETWKHLFEQNARHMQYGDALPWTDVQISEFMMREFPEAPARSKSVDRVAVLRNEYNNGAYSFKRWGIPAIKSVEYVPSSSTQQHKVVQTPETAPTSATAESANFYEALNDAVEAVERRLMKTMATELKKLQNEEPKQLVINWSAKKLLKTTVNLEGKHKKFSKVMTKLAAGLPVMLVGPSGSGKTHLCGQVAEALGVPFTFNSMSAGISESALLGRTLPDKTGAFVYVDSPFVRSFRDGGLHLLDEMDAADSNLLVQINAALSNGMLSIPNASAEPIKRHKDFYLIGACNTFGNGPDRVYVGRAPQDGSTIARYSCSTVEIDYDTDLEVELVNAILPNNKIGRELLKFFWDVRRKAADNKLRQIVGTRSIIDAAKCIAVGETLDQVSADFFVRWSRDERARVGA